MASVIASAIAAMIQAMSIRKMSPAWNRRPSRRDGLWSVGAVLMATQSQDSAQQSRDRVSTHDRRRSWRGRWSRQQLQYDEEDRHDHDRPDDLADRDRI